MLALPDRLRLRNLISDTRDEAKIVDLTPSIARRRIDEQWWKLSGVASAIMDAQPDAAWRKWSAIAAQAQDSAEYACVGCVTSQDKFVQGAMLYWTDGHSLIEPVLGAVEVLLLASAPWNRPIIGNTPMYRGVGSALLLRAVVHSYLLGYEGRTVLESKPVPRTIQFYINRGFTHISSHSHTADDKIIMELEPQAARRWLQAEGLIT